MNLRHWESSLIFANDWCVISAYLCAYNYIKRLFFSCFRMNGQGQTSDITLLYPRHHFISIGFFRLVLGSVFLFSNDQHVFAQPKASFSPFTNDVLVAPPRSQSFS